MSGEADYADIVKVLSSIFRILDSLKYECSASQYTLDDYQMGNVFYCKDLAELALKGKDNVR